MCYLQKSSTECAGTNQKIDIDKFSIRKDTYGDFKWAVNGMMI